jgi:hypothetical protein
MTVNLFRWVILKHLATARVFAPNGIGDDGFARARLPEDASPLAEAIEIKARFPGAAGVMRVQFDMVIGQNLLKREKNDFIVNFALLIFEICIDVSNTFDDEADGLPST